MKQFGLIGKHLGHSFSKSFFENYFSSKGIEATYANIEIASIEQFEIIKENYSGFNVTIPYKESIIPFLNDLDDVAKDVGAVNTIKVIEGKYIGHNTDVVGFGNMIKPFLTNKHERALILGTGGAAKAVKYVLQKIGVDCYHLSRNPQMENEFSYDDVNEVMIDAFKLIVNTTPVGMYPNTEEYPLLPYQAMSEDHLVIDLIYNPEETIFLTKSRAAGATILNGLSTLKEQALESYRIWNE